MDYRGWPICLSADCSVTQRCPLAIRIFKHMKRVLLFLFFLVALTTSATHIIGGEIRYTYIGNGFYDIEMIIYRDPNGGPAFDNPALVGLFDDNGVELFVAAVDLDSVNFVPFSADTCYANGAGQEVVVERGYYHETVQLPIDSIGYHLVYQRCCRNSTIINIPTPLQWGATYGTYIPPRNQMVNSNPQFPLPPPIVVCVNEAFTYNHSGMDADSDSLSYFFGTPFTGGSPTDPTPIPIAPPHTIIPWAPGYSDAYPVDAAPGFAIDPVTGVITGTPNTIGQYVLQVVVVEWRNGVEINRTWRDFQVNVVQCLPYPVASIVLESDSCSGLTAVLSPAGTDYTSNTWLLYAPDGTFIEQSTDSLFNVAVADTGAYSVVLVLSNGVCSDSDSIPLWLYNSDVGLEILGLDSVCYPIDEPTWGIVPTLPAEGNSKWILNQVAVGLDPPSDTEFKIGKNELIYLKRYRGCLWSDTLDVWWAGCADIEPPNVFTPNGDGQNEFWYPFWDVTPERVEIIIFNRWGTKVWEGASNNPDLFPGWNGVNYSSKKDCPEGTYYYVVKGFAFGEVFSQKTGFLTLLR